MEKKDKKYPLITIGITCYNAADTIKRAIISAQLQDWPNFEIIIVDDCSIDNSIDIINQYSKIDNPIKIIKHEINKGCAAARNAIIDNSNGEFIAFFDDDDESHKIRIRTQYNYITEFEKKLKTELIACYASGIRKYPNGYDMPFRAIGSEGKIPFGNLIVDFLLFFRKEKGYFYGAGTPTCTLMCRRSTLEKAGKFDSGFKRIEDADFAIRLGYLNGLFIGTKEDLVIQYATTGSEKSALNEYGSFKQLVEKNEVYANKANMYDYILGWAMFKYYHFNKEPMRAFVQVLKLFVFYPIKTMHQFLQSVPKRIIHEYRMKR